MGKVYCAGVLIAFLLVACSVGSAQERIVEFFDPKIGGFSFVAAMTSLLSSPNADTDDNGWSCLSVPVW